MSRKVSRRQFLQGAAFAAAGAAVAACQPKTVIVEKEVEKEVTTVVEVEKEKVVEKVVTATPVPKAPITLDLWYRWGSEDGTSKALEASTDTWNERYPDMQVKPLSVPAGGGAMISEKLMTAIISGTAPHVAEIDMFVCPSWAARAAWQDLTPFVEAEALDVEQEFFLWAADEIRYKGRVFALPIMTDLTALAWNKQLFEEVGLDPDRPPQSNEELIEYADKLDKQEGGKFTRIGFDPTTTVVPWALGYFWLGCKEDPEGDFYDFGAGKCTCNHPRIVEALQWKVDWVNRYGIEEVTAFNSAFGWGEIDGMGNGFIGMRILGSWFEGMYQEYFPELEWGIAPAPIPEAYGGQAQGSCMGTEGLAIPRGTGIAESEAAWKYLRWMSGQDAVLAFNKAATNLPPRRDLFDHEWYQSTPQKAAQMKIVPCGFNRPAIAEGELLWTELLAADDKAIHGQGEPQALLDEVARKVDEAMESW